MNWQSVLKAAMEEPEVIADVAAGDSNFDRCCEETKDAMRADGLNTIGFNKFEDYGPNGEPIGDYEMIDVELDRIHCDWLYKWLDNHSHRIPLLSSGRPVSSKKFVTEAVNRRVTKVTRWLKIWDDCVAKGGGL